MAERTSQISFKITPALKAELEKAAAEDGRSVSTLVMRILEAWASGRLIEKPAKKRSPAKS